MKALLTSASFDADYGGPALSISRLGRALAVKGVKVGLWAPDGSAFTSSVVVSGSDVIRLSGGASRLLSHFGSPDLIHDSGIWLAHNHAIATMSRKKGIPRIVSPRGMLEPWAISYKRIKKNIAWYCYQKRDLSTADGLHATSQAEAKQLKALGLSPPIHLVPNGMDIPDDVEVEWANATRSAGNVFRTALFLSRVHPKKGLPLLIEAWTRLRPQGWRLIIAGPSEVGHSNEIATLVRQRGLAESVQIIGPQYGEEKALLLRSSSLFILPTYSENFGMAVAEALAYGIPVLTTTGAPWSELVEYRAGWWVAPNADSITEALSNALEKPIAELQAMGARGRELIRKSYGWDGVAERMIESYEGMLRSRANCRVG